MDLEIEHAVQFRYSSNPPRPTCDPGGAASFCNRASRSRRRRPASTLMGNQFEDRHTLPKGILWPPLPHSIRPSNAASKIACNACAGAQRALTRASHMTLRRWHNLSDFVTSARQCVAPAQPCCREIRGLRLSFAGSVPRSVMLVQPSARNSKMSKQCASVLKRVAVALRPAGKSPNPVPFAKPRKGLAASFWSGQHEGSTQSITNSGNKTDSLLFRVNTQ